MLSAPLLDEHPQYAVALDDVLDRAAAVRWPDLDEQTQDATLRATMDSLAVAACGRVAPGVQQTLEVYGLAGGQGATVIPWWDGRLGVADAMMALSLLIHAWDFDDTHDSAVVYACTVAVPAALAAAGRRCQR